jgi:thioredoxin reductase
MMHSNHEYDVIIVGGSYAGLSAAMTLGRSRRRVLVLDSGLPCNRQTPHSHNFITQDGQTPAAIAAKAREQVLQYPTITIQEGLATAAQKLDNGFRISTGKEQHFEARKLIFATGLKDTMPDIPGFAACWGISVVHCPYCHGYEIRDAATGILANGDAAMHYALLVSNLSKDLCILTNGPAAFTDAQRDKLAAHNIPVLEQEVAAIEHKEGILHSVVFKDGSTMPLTALYARAAMSQHCPIPEALGCTLNEQGLLQVDMMQQTTVPGVYACGDNSNFARTVSQAAGAGTMAGAAVNKALCDEDF